MDWNSVTLVRDTHHILFFYSANMCLYGTLQFWKKKYLQNSLEEEASPWINIYSKEKQCSQILYFTFTHWFEWVMSVQTIWRFGPSLKYKVEQTFIVILNYISHRSIDSHKTYIYWNFINNILREEGKKEKIEEIFTLKSIVN